MSEQYCGNHCNSVSDVIDDCASHNYFDGTSIAYAIAARRSLNRAITVIVRSLAACVPCLNSEWLSPTIAADYTVQWTSDSGYAPVAAALAGLLQTTTTTIRFPLRVAALEAYYIHSCRSLLYIAMDDRRIEYIQYKMTDDERQAVINDECSRLRSSSLTCFVAVDKLGQLTLPVGDYKPTI